MTKIRVLVFLSTILIVSVFGFAAAFYARGYRIDLKTYKLHPSGILAVKSNPDGAQVFVGNQPVIVTDNYLSLKPGEYNVEIKKEGYRPWNKKVAIIKELVTEIDATLFLTTPQLSAITFDNATSPVASRDQSKIIYGAGKGGLWMLENTNTLLGFSRDPKQLSKMDVTKGSWKISPDGRQVILTISKVNYLIDTNTLTSSTVVILPDWETAYLARIQAQLKNLDFIDAKTAIFSPDESKILYIKDKNYYVYDIKEKEEYAIGDEKLIFKWLPTSRHLLNPQTGKIIIMDYDGANRQEILADSYVYPYAFPSASINKIILLTDNNLYSMTVK